MTLEFRTACCGGGRLGLVGVFWQAICAALCCESWKWTTNWRIFFFSSEPACSNLNYMTGRLETRSGNSVSCVPQCLSSFSPYCVYLFWKTFQDSNCHRTLVFATWNTIGQLWATLIFLPLKWSLRGWRSYSAACSPSSALESLGDPGKLCYRFEFTKVQSSWIMTSPKNRLQLQSE